MNFKALIWPLVFGLLVSAAVHRNPTLGKIAAGVPL
tara:strand:- start:9445 stop:9552 length:108 start_codon:yes stop_codon:yes gene_type:complete